MSKGLADRIHDKFYRWFERMWSGTSIIADGFSRRNMRDAYEAGYRNARQELLRLTRPDAKEE